MFNSALVLRENEQDWWYAGRRDAYDNERLRDSRRGRPRTRLQKHKKKTQINIPDIDPREKIRLYKRATTLSGDWGPSGDGVESRAMSPIPQGELDPESPTERAMRQKTATSDSPWPELPARNDRDRNKSLDSVASPDWAAA